MPGSEKTPHSVFSQSVWGAALRVMMMMMMMMMKKKKKKKDDPSGFATL